jgi:LysR family glycine cleavage system transcriptional activator
MTRTPLYALQGFVAAARLRNLSRAAAALHLTVSALSHQLRGLEERLGRRLFDRGPRGVSFTPDGERLYDRIAPHLDAIEQALQPYSARRDDVLTLSLMPSFAASWLVPRLARFVAAHPQIEINLQSSSALVDFAREPVDAALRFGPGNWAGLQAEHLFDDWITPTASPALIARVGRPTLATLGDFPLLGDPGNRWAEWFERFGGREPARFVAHFNDSETLHRAAAEGLGIALGRVTLARPLVDAGRLLPLFAQRLQSEFSHYLVHPPRSDGHRGLAAFRTWLLDEARRYTRELARIPTLPARRAGRRAAPGPVVEPVSKRGSTPRQVATSATRRAPKRRRG